MAQVEVKPPRFVFFVNHPDLLSHSYHKYLINQFRLSFPYEGVPLTFYLKGKKREAAQAKASKPHFLEEELQFEDQGE